MKRRIGLLIFLLAGCLALQPTVGAFADIEPESEEVLYLKQRGIVQGMDGKHFFPKEHLTYAQAVQLLVKGFKLNIDPFRFPKAPQASDYFNMVTNDAWYSSSFVIAQLNGINLAKDINPKKEMTREKFADMLMDTVLKTGDYMFIELFILIEDQKDISPTYMGSIQKLLITKIGQLDDAQYFHPTSPITREEAAIWLYRAIQFVESHNQIATKES